MMNEIDFLNAVIDDGEAEVRQHYLRLDQAEKRSGALDGFGACRGKTIEEMAKLRLHASNQADQLQRDSVIQGYWYWRCYAAQVEWTLNCLASRQFLLGQPPGASATYRGVRKAAEILGSPFPQ